MVSFVLNLLSSSALMTLISLFYILLSDKLKCVWSAKSRRFVWIFIIIGFLVPFKPKIVKPAFEIIVDSQPINKMSDINYNSPNYFHLDSMKTGLFAFLFLLWLSVAIIKAMIYIIRHQQFRSHLCRTSIKCDENTERITREIAHKMGIDRIDVVVLPSVKTPMLTGYYNPVIILPEYNYPKKELQFIIRHELTHLKKSDILLKFFVLVCKCVHWFNPFISHISDKIDEVCELACDEIVITDEEKDGLKIYCQSIISTAMLQNKDNTLKPAISTDFGNPKHNFQHRLRMIIGTYKKKNLFLISLLIIALTIFSSAIFGISYFEAESHTNPIITDTTTFVDIVNQTTVVYDTTIAVPDFHNNYAEDPSGTTTTIVTDVHSETHTMAVTEVNTQSNSQSSTTTVVFSQMIPEAP